MLPVSSAGKKKQRVKARVNMQPIAAAGHKCGKSCNSMTSAGKHTTSDNRVFELVLLLCLVVIVLLINVLCRTLGRSPSPMKGMRGTSQSLDWDHSVDTKSPQGIVYSLTNQVVLVGGEHPHRCSICASCASNPILFSIYV